MDFIYKLLCCLVWFPLGGGTFCDPNRTRVKICTYQDVTNTTGVHIDTVRAPYFQQTSCECLITPITHTILLHFHLVSLSESVQFEINDISVDKNHVYKKTNITGAMKFLLTTNENYKSGGACLAVYSDNGDKFNISCTASTKETGQTRTLNIPQSSEAVNISRTRTVSPKTIQNITTNVSTGRVTSENSITTDNVNGNNDAKGDDKNIDSTGTNLQTTVLSNQTFVPQESELTAFATSSTIKSTLYVSSNTMNDIVAGDDTNIDSTGTTVLSNQSFVPQESEFTAFTTSSTIKSTLNVSSNTMNDIESQSQAFCNHSTYRTVQVCADDEALNTIAVLIDTIGVPDFPLSSCDCVITPSRNNVPFYFNLTNPSVQRRMQFQINDIHLNKYNMTGRTTLTYATQLLLLTEENHKRGRVCLAVYSGNGTYFNITCKKAREETARQSSPSPISHGSQTTENTTFKPSHSTMQASKDKINGDNHIIFPSVTAACGLLLGIVIAVVCVIFYKRRKNGKGRNATTVSSTNAPVESDYYMTENAMYNMGQICTRETINENEHNNVNHNDGESPGHYDCIQESTYRNQSSENSPNHAVSNEYSTCLKVSKRSDGGSNNKRSIIDKEEQSQFSKMNGKDDTVYDSTISTFTQQAVGDNDYHHLGSVGLTGLNLTYDRIGNTGVVRH